MEIELNLNGRRVVADIEPQELLLDFLRDRMRLTGSKRSCEVQVCGTCTVLVDDEPVSACPSLAHEAPGRVVLTIEEKPDAPEYDHYEAAFDRVTGLQ